jgi:hypothetical protein
MPPEGATCAEHPERDALVTCPRCGSYCCLTCWHSAVQRCHACLLRDPGPPVPWEDGGRGLVARLGSTLADAFRPSRSAPAFARSRWTSSISFALLSFIPLALVSGVIPYTHSLVFGAGQVQVIGNPGSAALALDVARAGLIGLVVALAKLLCIGIPYQSLSRAYASRGNRTAGLSAILYRGWLIPLAEVVLGLLVWLLPAEPTETATMFVWIASLVPLIVLISSLLAIARMASGVGPIAALIVVLVPFVLMMVVTPIGLSALRPWLPDPEVVRQLAGSAS